MKHWDFVGDSAKSLVKTGHVGVGRAVEIQGFVTFCVSADVFVEEEEHRFAFGGFVIPPRKPEVDFGVIVKEERSGH